MRWAAFMGSAVGVPAPAAVRMAIPMSVFGLVVGLPLTAAFPVVVTAAELGTIGEAVLLGCLALVCVSAAAILVAGRLGRPSFLIVPTCRGMSDGEIEEWLARPSGREVSR